jgi:hypothetical protein
MTTPAERSRAYRDRKRGGPARTPQPHGTRAAFRRHERAGEPPCDACKAWQAQYQRERYVAKKSRQTP